MRSLFGDTPFRKTKKPNVKNRQVYFYIIIGRCTYKHKQKKTPRTRIHVGALDCKEALKKMHQ